MTLFAEQSGTWIKAVEDTSVPCLVYIESGIADVERRCRKNMASETCRRGAILTGVPRQRHIPESGSACRRIERLQEDWRAVVDRGKAALKNN
jgi:hypothetical protein